MFAKFSFVSRTWRECFKCKAATQITKTLVNETEHKFISAADAKGSFL